MKHKPILPKDHPRINRSDWYSTHDVMKIFDWKRGLLKNWIEQGFIKPASWTEDARGRISFFAGFQLYSLKLFKYLIDMGFSRRFSSAWVKRIENEIIGGEQLDMDKVKYAVFEFSDQEILRVSFFEDPVGINIDWKDNSNDFLVINYKRIVDEVDAVS